MTIVSDSDLKAPRTCVLAQAIINQMGVAHLLLVCFSTSLATTIKVLSFNSSSKDHLSSALLVQSTTLVLPERFIACFSMKQDKTERGPLLIRDKNNQPWVALKILNYGGQIALWGEVSQSEWWVFQELTTSWKFWTHVCGDFDTVTGNITVSIDGSPSVTKTFERLRDGKPANLDRKLEIGKSESALAYGGNSSFLGEVSNVHFHFFDGSLSVETLSGDPCRRKGSYLGWSDMSFVLEGENVFQVEESESEVCAVKPEFYKLTLPVKATWPKAGHLCKVIGGGKMTEAKNDSDLVNIASAMRNILESCPAVWLPLSDEKKEGVWENTNTNSESNFLNWADGQPNGLRNQNHAVLILDSLTFGDFSAEDEHCVSCTLSTGATLVLRGACKDSFLSKKLFSTKKKC